MKRTRIFYFKVTNGGAASSRDSHESFECAGKVSPGSTLRFHNRSAPFARTPEKSFEKSGVVEAGRFLDGFSIGPTKQGIREGQDEPVTVFLNLELTVSMNTP
jgi:hypothetical protein